MLGEANPAGPFWSTVDLGSPGERSGGSRDVEIADLDGDGLGEIVLAADGPPALVIWSSAGGEDFGPPTTIPFGDGPNEVEVRDLDADGRPDLVVADATGRSVVIHLAEPG